MSCCCAAVQSGEVRPPTAQQTMASGEISGRGQGALTFGQVCAPIASRQLMVGPRDEPCLVQQRRCGRGDSRSIRGDNVRAKSVVGGSAPDGPAAARACRPPRRNRRSSLSAPPLLAPPRAIDVGSASPTPLCRGRDRSTRGPATAAGSKRGRAP